VTCDERLEKLLAEACSAADAAAATGDARRAAQATRQIIAIRGLLANRQGRAVRAWLRQKRTIGATGHDLAKKDS
jgi:hypothetical protein